MPPRGSKKTSSLQQSLTAPVAAPAAAFEIPRQLRYKTETGEPWQAERFDLLASSFALAVKSEAEASAVLKQFHDFVRKHPLPWQLVRRLFGVAPVIPPPETHEDDLRTWTREELVTAGHYGDAKMIDAELEALRSMWRDHLTREASAAKPETVSTGLTSSGNRSSEELDLDDKLLTKFQFSERIFKIYVFDPTAGENGEGKEVPRADSENKAEREWFASRVKGWQKMLGDAMGGPVARAALMNDLHLRRMEYEIAVSPANRRSKLMETQQQIARDYSAAIEKLQEMFPDIAVAGRVTFRAVLSDVINGHRDYYARADRRLVDKVFTASEIEFQLRDSLQLKARHRFSLGLAIVENIHGLYDPDFRTQFKPSTLKMIDAMTRAAREAARENLNETVVDLERGVSPDEPDQYEDFHDHQCTAMVKGVPCGKWHSSSKPCPNKKNHDAEPEQPD